MEQFYNISELKYKPYDRYGTPIDGLYWCELNFDKATSYGTFILKFQPGSRTNFHEHTGTEEFYIIDGILHDSKANVFRPGTFITMPPGSRHYTWSPSGCTVLVFSQGPNIIISE